MPHSYQSLARKWRPQTFAELVGHTHAIQGLQTMLQAHSIHPALLFTGTRGVGKTTIARIFAKALSCKTWPTADACNQCDHCMAIKDGSFLDLIEIDGASCTKVEDTRELLEQVHYPPARGRFKIYLIDEVHMLSTHSFNALLKTLEEPPAHVIFLLATTDPQKIPLTVQSRLIKFHLHPLQSEPIAQHLRHVLQTEKISHDPEACTMVAHLAKGSMRDAMTQLEQLIALCGGSLTEAQATQTLGQLPQSMLEELVQALAQQNPTEVQDILQRIAALTDQYELLVDQLILHLHSMLRQRILAPDSASDISILQCNAWLATAQQGKQELGLHASPQLAFELIILRMLALHLSKQSLQQLLQSNATAAQPRTKPNHQNPGHTGSAERTPSHASQSAPATPDASPPPASTPSAPSQTMTLDSLRDVHAWQSFIATLPLSGMAKDLLRHTTPLTATQGENLHLSLPSLQKNLLTARQTQNILDTLRKALNMAGLHIHYQEEADDSKPSTPESAPPPPSKPAKAPQKSAVSPQAQSVMDAFSGTITRNDDNQ